MREDDKVGAAGVQARGEGGVLDEGRGEGRVWCQRSAGVPGGVELRSSRLLNWRTRIHGRRGGRWVEVEGGGLRTV